MLRTTLQSLHCPKCKASFSLYPSPDLPGQLDYPGHELETRSGHLQCDGCEACYPILAGVAVVVADVGGYLAHHVKGISKLVKDIEIPDEHLEEYLEAKSEIEVGHIEEDLEAERVNALYLMNHYLRVTPEPAFAWWKSLSGDGSPLIESLVRTHWDSGPFSQIGQWVREQAESHAGSQTESLKGSAGNVLELGCGVGGLASVLKPYARTYLGVDSSFASIALARHLQLGVPYAASLKIPGDLLQGGVSREIKIAKSVLDGRTDFVVGEVEQPPLKAGVWDLSVALNMIDMMDEPAVLPQLQHALVKKGGLAIQSCPYIWHEGVAAELRPQLPAEIQDSARAVEWLYSQAGWQIEKRVEHLPWLFFKHLRQLEVYDVHCFQAKKPS